MKIDDTVNDVSGFYAVDFEVFTQTLGESTIEDSFDMGGGVEIKHGRRYGLPIWLMDNPGGELYGIWVESENSLH